MNNLLHRAPQKLSPYDIKKGLPNVDIVSHVHTHLDYSPPSAVYDVKNFLNYTFGKYVLNPREIIQYETKFSPTSMPRYDINVSLFIDPLTIKKYAK